MENGKFHQRDSLLKMIAMTIKTQDHHPEICKTKDLYLSKKKMLTSIEALRNFSSIEPMVTGKSKLFSHLTLLEMMELKDSQMVHQIALNALEINVTLATNLLSTPKPSMIAHAVMIAKLMDHGLQVSTPESIEIKKSLTP